MRVIEQYTIGKSTTTPSEDAVVVTPYYAAVIDGASPKTSFRFDNDETPGARAARLLASAVWDLPREADVLSAFTLLNTTLTQHGVAPANRPTASMVIFSRLRREMWSLGDCQYALLKMETDGKSTLHSYTNHKRIDKILSQWRSDILHSLLSRGICTREEVARQDPGRKIIQHFITQQVRYQNLQSNHPLAFGALDGADLLTQSVLCHPIEPEVKQIILASDGYPILTPTLKETEAELQRLLLLDPLCIGPLTGTKGVAKGNISYDDRTYLRLEL